MIKPETLHFIKELSEHNDRNWFAAHKDEYEAAKENVLHFISLLIPMLSEVDPAFPKESIPKKHLMRIYRDVRFSKDKRPYKNNFGIYFSLNGKGGNEPGYYLNIAPGNCFFAGGYWMPDAGDLKKIREEIDYNADGFVEIIKKKSFSALLKLDTEDSLKKAPKGYPADHPLIDVLKLKSFSASCMFDDQEMTKPDIVEKIQHAFEQVYPFILFLRASIAT
jgi:uncharacterized protein (TIGR02453 family)